MLVTTVISELRKAVEARFAAAPQIPRGVSRVIGETEGFRSVSKLQDLETFGAAEILIS